MTSPTPEQLRQFVADDGALDGKTVLVTGASDGIGKATAMLAAKAGATVVMMGRTQKKLESAHDEIVAAGAKAPVIVPIDFMKAEGGVYLALADQLREDFGQLHALVHCAGMLGQMTDIEEYDAAIWQQVMHVNVTSAFALTKVCIPLIKPADGAIVFASSSVGRRGRAFWGAYSVSKFATEGLAQTLADELSASNVRVNVVNPGATRTAMRREAYPAEDPADLRTAEEIAPAFLYFVCDATGGVTGQSVDAQ
ncbi:MAG: YciK family oxidoreductase [Pseudomonadota bacterium]